MYKQSPQPKGETERKNGWNFFKIGENCINPQILELPTKYHEEIYTKAYHNQIAQKEW